MLNISKDICTNYCVRLKPTISVLALIQIYIQFGFRCLYSLKQLKTEMHSSMFSLFKVIIFGNIEIALTQKK